ncbi:MAG: PEP-CTERM sorting domain-containing protein, partial [Planctomycetota bacterium]
AIVSGSNPNYGWALVTSGSYSTSGAIGNYGYSTNASTTQSQRPALFVEYVPVPEPSTTAVIVTAFGIAAASRRRRRSSNHLLNCS